MRSMIPRSRQISVGRKKPYVYEIHLALRDSKWSIDRRYSDFYALHREVCFHRWRGGRGQGRIGAAFRGSDTFEPRRTLRPRLPA